MQAARTVRAGQRSNHLRCSQTAQSRSGTYALQNTQAHPCSLCVSNLVSTQPIVALKHVTNQLIFASIVLLRLGQHTPAYVVMRLLSSLQKSMAIC